MEGSSMFYKTIDNYTRVSEGLFFNIVNVGVHEYPDTRQLSEKEVLAMFIKSKYFLRREEFLDKVHVTSEGHEMYVHWNFHGFYDVDKIDMSCFDKVEFGEFKHRFIEYIRKEVDMPEFRMEIENYMSAELDLSNVSYYVIKELPEEYMHKWSVYAFFISGIIYHHIDKKIQLVTFGMD